MCPSVTGLSCPYICYRATRNRKKKKFGARGGNFQSRIPAWKSIDPKIKERKAGVIFALRKTRCSQNIFLIKIRLVIILFFTNCRCIFIFDRAESFWTKNNHLLKREYFFLLQPASRILHLKIYIVRIVPMSCLNICGRDLIRFMPNRI